jgi:hypothetical protein
MAKYLSLEEAAQNLGITPAELNGFRERHQINALRDGASWKFRPDDVERFKAQQGDEELSGPEAEFAEVEEDQESILLSDVELGGSPPGTGSTVIGPTESSGSDIKLAQSGSKVDPAGSSDVRLADELDLLPTGSGISSKFDDLDTLDLDLPSAAESGLTPRPQSKSDLDLAGVDELSLGDSDLSLGEEPTGQGSSPTLKGGSAIELGMEDDDDLVLGGSGTGSDVTRAPGDSGISLMASDSGLSIEEQPGVGGSGIESLDLGEEDMMLLEEEKQPAGEAAAEDDFLLTPLGEGGDESDSGSQVIALDAESDLDDSAATMLGGDVSPMLEEDLGPADLGGPALAGTGLGTAAGASLMGAPHVPESSYSLANIGMLVLCLLPLTLCGMMMFDLAMHMWSWDQPYTVNSKIMDSVLSWFEKK